MHKPKPFLWNDYFGHVVATGEQWSDDKGVRWGAFHTMMWGAHVNLRLEEVMIDWQ